VAYGRVVASAAARPLPVVCQNRPVTTEDPRAVDVVPARAPVPPRYQDPPPRRWMVILVAIWITILVVGAGWGLVHSQPTDREQTTVAAARPVVDAAAARVITAATSDGQAVAVLADFAKVGDCRVTVFRGGSRYDREVTVIVPAGTEGALLSRVADRLPRGYGATVEHNLLIADAGDFVRLTGSVATPGQVRFVADTGACRETGDLPSPPAFAGDRSRLAPILSTLDITTAQYFAYQVSCPDGGTASTVEAVGPDGVVAGSTDIRAALAGRGTAVVAAPETYAYVDGGTGVAVRVQNRHLVVTATTNCPQ